MAAETTYEHAVHRLRETGHVTLPGRESAPLKRWLRGRRRLAIASGIVTGVGLVAFIVGLALHDVGSWPLAILIGAFVTFTGLVVLIVVIAGNQLMRGRIRAETQPVSITPAGVTLRGIGPIPWSDLARPERRNIVVRSDVGGRCTVMPLTHQGHARANAQPNGSTHLIGPKPYLRFDVPYLLLPGIAGLTEDETLELFRIAHQRYAEPSPPESHPTAHHH